MVKTIIKRDGRTAEFHPEKIADAVEKSFQACAAMQGRDTAEKIAATVVEKLESGAIEGTPTVEGVQDLVEETLIESGFVQTAKAYILYRAERSRVRDVNSRLIQTLKDITFSKAADSDMKRENANIDADTAMGTMLKYGSESAKQFYEMCVIDPRYAKGDAPAAVLTREGAGPFMQVLRCADKLAGAVRSALTLSTFAGLFGMLIVFYLVFQNQAAALPVQHLLLYLLIWYIPVFIINQQTH